ncbi:hypothetical protein FRC01_012395 [Tulasnella sp. 417]|nr:hypothetical protein FRC01_012395 [Tulasnella sp. 417]
MSTSSPEKLTELPEIPKEIGEDGGRFYKYYDELAEESDDELVKSLKAQLDGILIFAGLFAGVNSAFLALTLPRMSADPADDTNALLLQIALGGNGSITSAADLPSASFTPPPRIYPINALFSVSLTLALLSSFLSVLGQQWLVYYRKRVSGGPEYQRWERLRRYLGAKRWQLELVLDDVVPKPQRESLFNIKRPSEVVKMCSMIFTWSYRWCMSAGARSPEDPGELKFGAVKRVICTSEDQNALIYSAVGIYITRDVRMLSSLGKDEEFCTRLSSLAQAALRQTHQRKTSSPYSFIESKIFSLSLLHIMFSTCSDPYITLDDQLNASESLGIPFDQMDQLHQASVIAFDTSCDGCSHCAPLLFSIIVAYAIIDSTKKPTRLQLNTAFKCAMRMSAATADLRLGFMVASMMQLLKQRNDSNPMFYWDYLRLLFAAYREASEQQMFQTILRALATVSARWKSEWKPDYEIYAWLFEFWLSPERKEVSIPDQLAVLEHVGDHLLSIERWIRSGDLSMMDRRRGRDYQNRYVQSVANFFSNRTDSSQQMWTLVGPPLERYIRTTMPLMETNFGSSQYV